MFSPIIQESIALGSDFFGLDAEFKFIEGGQPGEFEGYGAVFSNADSHGDVIVPGAFAESLAQHKAKGTMPGLFAEHSAFTGGDPLPIGAWTDMSEDERGLRVKGRLSALDTDHGRRIRSLMQDGALKGLSIAYTVPAGGSTRGTKAGEPLRTLKKVNLESVDIVRSPSNFSARIDAIKSAMKVVDHAKATDSIVSAIKLHRDTMSKGDAPTVDERGQMLTHLQDAHTALTGAAFQVGQKSMPTTIREFETRLREEFGLSNSQARLLAENGFKTAQAPRDEEAEQAAAAATKQALTDISVGLSGFSLPTF